MLRVSDCRYASAMAGTRQRWLLCASDGWYTPAMRRGRGAMARQRIMMYHHRIVRTTIDIPEHLLIEAKQLAAERHLPLTRLFEDSLRLYLGEQRSRRAQAEPAPLPLLRDPVPVEGIDLDDTSLLWE